MKQIFDWLREQMQSNSNASEAEMYYMLDEDRGQCCLYSEIDLEEQKSKQWLDAKSLVDEAEAKWEQDCCIRVVGKPFTSSCGQKWDKWTDVGEPYCSKCGKRIKISEVD